MPEFGIPAVGVPATGGVPGSTGTVTVTELVDRPSCTVAVKVSVVDNPAAWRAAWVGGVYV